SPHPPSASPTLSLHDALPISIADSVADRRCTAGPTTTAHRGLNGRSPTAGTRPLPIESHMAAAHRAVHCGPANRGRYSAHMPEGHTIHALAERLNRAFAGHAIHASSPQGRFAGGAIELDGTEFLAAQAWGKHLLVEFAAERWLHVHLGLIGNFAVVPLPAQERGESPEQIPVTGTVRLRLVGPEHVA